MIEWINGAGAVTLEQIAVWMGVDFSTAARRIRKLIAAGLLRRAAVPFLTSCPIIPTRLGCALADDALPPLRGIRVGTWRHDYALVDVARILELRMQGKFEPARRIQSRWDAETHRHLPDGYLHRPQEKPVAVELELSQKAPRRLAHILDQYEADMSISGVTYLAGSERIALYIRRFVGTRGDFIRVGVVRLRTTGANS